jgi:K+-sensing histidine kinase KdpD
MSRAKERTMHLVVDTAALLLCAVAAWTVAQFGWEPAHRRLLPFAFLGLVLLLGFLYGRTVGMLGTIVSVVVFAYTLYQPLGSVAVADDGARSSLAWAILLGVSASFLLLPGGGHHHKDL